MRLNRVLRNSILFFILFVLYGFGFVTDSESKEHLTFDIVIKRINELHYAPQKLNDELSKKAFDQYVERLDYGKRFFINTDMSILKEYEYKIDDEIKTRSFEFFELSLQLIDERITEAEGYYKEILDKPFDFSKDEEIETDGEKLKYALSKQLLKERWCKALKFQVLIKLNASVRIQETAKEENDTSVEIKSFEVLEKEAREKASKSNDNWFKRLHQLDRSDRYAAYVNSITNVYDPHTSFFPPKSKDDFDIRMSGRLEGIGATLRQKDGYITVVNIVPGSASWRQGELKAGDMILKVAQADNDPVDVVDMRLDKAVQLIRGKKGTEVRLTIKKRDGQIVVIPIIRDVVIIEETYAKSAVLYDADSTAKIGYIHLPKFYIDFNNSNGRRCATDVKVEIAKLNKEHVKGMILDLRGNSGGSLPEVVKIGGFFIDKGPIVQVKARYGMPDILSDHDSKVQYEDPLIIMINSFSASASEILAAAMQDYKRAVIIGSPTFGKGTVQRYFDMDRFVPYEDTDLKPLGALKITTQKFYRINGGATQLKGVIPDISLPDEYKYIEIGEREMDYYLPWDEIPSVDYNKWSSQSDLTNLNTKSIGRISQDTIFTLIEKNAKRLKEQDDISTYSLNFESYTAQQEVLKKEAKRFENLKTDSTGVKAFATDFDQLEAATDTVKQVRLESFQKGLVKDVYLKEAIEVMKDLLKAE